MKRRILMMLYFAALAAECFAVNDWENPAVTEINKEPRRATFTPFDAVETTSLDRTASPCFHARVGKVRTFNAHFFRNRLLWLALFRVVSFQVLAVQWTPAHGIFDVEKRRLEDWLLATLVASSVLLLEELRKMFLRIFRP